jgi:hypothetical protein
MSRSRRLHDAFAYPDDDDNEAMGESDLIHDVIDMDELAPLEGEDPFVTLDTLVQELPANATTINIPLPLARQVLSSWYLKE